MILIYVFVIVCVVCLCFIVHNFLIQKQNEAYTNIITNPTNFDSNLNDLGTNIANSANASLSYPNAAAILKANPGAPDGDYLLQPQGQHRALRCYINFSNARKGRGWVLIQTGRESTNFWNDLGQNLNTGLLEKNLGVNTPVANAPSKWIDALVGGWPNVKLLVNRPMTHDSYLYEGLTDATFSWSYFTTPSWLSTEPLVKANVGYFDKMWAQGNPKRVMENNGNWNDTAYSKDGIAPEKDDVTRNFSWNWDGHLGWQGWSYGSNVSQSLQNVGYHAGEGHPIGRVNVYVEC